MSPRGHVRLLLGALNPGSDSNGETRLGLTASNTLWRRAPPRQEAGRTTGNVTVFTRTTVSG